MKRCLERSLRLSTSSSTAVERIKITEEKKYILEPLIVRTTILGNVYPFMGMPSWEMCTLLWESHPGKYVPFYGNAILGNVYPFMGMPSWEMCTLLWESHPGECVPFCGNPILGNMYPFMGMPSWGMYTLLWECHPGKCVPSDNIEQ